MLIAEPGVGFLWPDSQVNALAYSRKTSFLDSD
jgi:hypothetical protein